MSGYPTPPSYPSGPASLRGWGPGWPNCQTGQITTIEVGGVRLPMRSQVAELTYLLVKETERLGYDLKTGWCWGFACRAISGTSTPSNHSWGLAVDINAPVNPYTQPRRTDIPPKVVQLWMDYNWRWGGFYNNSGTTGPADSMHFEFMGTPEGAKRLTDKARQRLGEHHPWPSPGDDGDKVLHVQKRFNRLGWADFVGGELDGVYGTQVRNAVRRMEREVPYLEERADGEFGAVSWATLMAPRLSVGRVQHGKTNWQVRFVQAALNVVLDPSPRFRASGHFDQSTREQWMRWQKRQGMDRPDGVPHRRGLVKLGEHYGFTVRKEKES